MQGHNDITIFDISEFKYLVAIYSQVNAIIQKCMASEVPATNYIAERTVQIIIKPNAITPEDR